VRGILALVAEGLVDPNTFGPAKTNSTNCQFKLEGGNASYLDISKEAAALMAVFAGIGWAVASIIYYLPVSSSTRATAAAIRDHALFAMALAGTGAALRQLTQFILFEAAKLAGVGSGYQDQLVNLHRVMYDFNFNSAIVAGTALAWLGTMLAIGPVIPVLGTILTFAAGVIYAPGTAMLAGIMIAAAMNAAGYFILHNSMMLIFPIGMALFAAPGRLAKGLGAFLISLSIVSYVALPILPWIVSSVTNVAAGGGVDPKSMMDTLNEICEMSRTDNTTVAGFFALWPPTGWYEKITRWLIMVATSSFLLALVVAAARALSHSLGGVSANL